MWERERVSRRICGVGRSPTTAPWPCMLLHAALPPAHNPTGRDRNPTGGGATARRHCAAPRCDGTRGPGDSGRRGTRGTRKAPTMHTPHTLACTGLRPRHALGMRMHCVCTCTLCRWCTRGCALQTLSSQHWHSALPGAQSLARLAHSRPNTVVGTMVILPGCCE